MNPRRCPLPRDEIRWARVGRAGIGSCGAGKRAATLLAVATVVDTAAVPAASGSEDIVKKNLDILLEGFIL